MEDKRLAEQTHIQTAGFLYMCSHAKRYLLIDQRVASRSERIESIAQHERPFHVFPSAGPLLLLKTCRTGVRKYNKFQSEH